MGCTCNAPDCGPGSGHESGCGRPEMCLACELDDCSDCEEWIEDRQHGCCCGELQMSAEDIAEERLKSRDYESWADL